VNIALSESYCVCPQIHTAQLVDVRSDTSAVAGHI
jgi:hypothetical protein